VVVDARNRIRLANQTARSLLGLDNPEHQELATAAPELARQLYLWNQEHEWQPREIRAQTAGVTLIPRFSTMRTADGGSTLVLLDDSAHLARRTQQIRLASLGRLTASIAHEIRNPLGAISHAAQLLEESEQLDSSDRRLTEIIGNHTRRVNTIIENVLQLSRRSASKPQTVHLNDWLQEFKREFAQTEQVDPECLRVDVSDTDIQVVVDPGHLHQILTNLCQNALRYAGDDARVIIRAWERETGVVRLDIADNGSGIDAETAEQIFEPFFTTASTGTGLGLYIARELCEINQARLSYQPAEDGGSCFSIHFAASGTEQGH
jgi:two-component system sensor histidine kinase PilS (NtrC family)